MMKEPVTVKYDHSISTSAEAVDQLPRPDDGPTAADCAAKPFSASPGPWMGIALNHDFSSNSIGRMRQVGLHIQVELFEPLTREQIFQIFGGAGISVHEIVGDKIKRFDILEFSYCPSSAQPAVQDAWLPIETAPKSCRALVCGGTRNCVDGYHDVQAAWIDGCGNVWADDRKEGSAPIRPTYWRPAPDAGK